MQFLCCAECSSIRFLVGVFLLYVCLSISLMFLFGVFVCLFPMFFYTFIILVQFVTIGGQHWLASAPLAACHILYCTTYILAIKCVCVCVYVYVCAAVYEVFAVDHQPLSATNLPLPLSDVSVISSRGQILSSPFVTHIYHSQTYQPLRTKLLPPSKCKRDVQFHWQ